MIYQIVLSSITGTLNDYYPDFKGTSLLNVEFWYHRNSTRWRHSYNGIL